MKTKIYLFFSSVLICFFIAGCGDDNVESAAFKHSINLTMDNLRNLYTIVESPNAHSGKKICRVDSGQHYGLIYTINVPDSIVEKEISVSIDAWVRTGSKDNNCAIVCSVTNAKDSILYWQELSALTVINQPNEWSNLGGNLTIPSSAIPFNTKINVFCFNGSARSYFEVDDLNVTFTEAEKSNP